MATIAAGSTVQYRKVGRAVVEQYLYGQASDEFQQYRVTWLSGPYAPGNAKAGRYTEVWLSTDDIIATA